MKGRLFAAMAFGLLAACATVRPSTGLPIGVPLQLATVDGGSVGQRTFRFELRHDGSYAATFSCNEHFGTYAYSDTLVLKAEASTALACDQVDLSTGRPIALDPSLANDFFADPTFRVSNRGPFVLFRNSRHTFGFVPSGTT